ncbi:hypothetical protein Tco_0115095 [Tanacetum coccineum]
MVFVSKASIRIHLKLEDSEGLKTLPTAEIFEQLALIRVKKLEQTIKTSQARRKAKVVIFDDEEAEEDPFNQGTNLIEELDLDAKISLVPPHAADQGRIDDTQNSDQPEEQLGVFSAATALTDAARRRESIENVQTYTRRRREVSTGSGGVSTASRLVSTTDISTASKLDSTGGVKAKDKGKEIMHESEPPKKIKKRVQVQISVDEELAKKQLDEREEVAAKVDQAHDINWSDPDNQESSKPVEEVIVQQDDVIAEQAVKESSRTAGGRRKKLLARKRAKETLSEESAKKQNLEDDIEKEEL